MTNHLRDTRHQALLLRPRLPGGAARDVRLQADLERARVSARAVVSKKTSTYTLLQLNLGRRIYSGKTNAYRLVFDLVDKGGAAARDVRVGGSLVSFPVWAFATDSTPGSTVKVVFPAGYQVEVQAGEIPAPTTAADGTITFQTGKLDKPLTFFAYLVADRPGTYIERTETATIGGSPIELTIRAWADDEPWAERVGGLVVARRCPVLAEQIGLPWPRDGGLVFHETHQPLDRWLRRAVRPVVRPGRGGLRRR